MSRRAAAGLAVAPTDWDIVVRTETGDYVVARGATLRRSPP